MFSLLGVRRVWGDAIAVILKNYVLIVFLLQLLAGFHVRWWAGGNRGLDGWLLRPTSQSAVSLILWKLVHFTNTPRFSYTATALHFQMLCIENYSLFFVAAHTVTLKRSLETAMAVAGYSISLAKSKAEIKNPRLVLLVTTRQWLPLALGALPRVKTSAPHPLFIWSLAPCTSKWKTEQELVELAIFSEISSCTVFFIYHFI